MLWQAVGIYEGLAREGHEPAKRELVSLLGQMRGAGADHAATALGKLKQAELI